MKAKKLMVHSTKGGIGKTTSVMTIARHFAKQGRKVCMIDVDPQANLTKTMLKERAREEGYVSMYDLFVPVVEDSMIEKAIMNVSDNLWIIGSNLRLCYRENEFSGNTMVDRSRILDKIVKKIEDRFDLIIMDFNPFPSLLVTNGFLTCDCMIIPTMCDEWSAEGVAVEISLLMQAEVGYGKKTPYRVFVNGYGRTKKDKEFIEDIENQLDDDELFKTKIRFQSAPFGDKDVAVTDYKGGKTNVAHEWSELLKEIEIYVFDENEDE